jgi:hypothetical protein
LPYSDQGRFLLIKKREITPFYHSRERTNDKKKYQPHEKDTHHIIYPHMLYAAYGTETDIIKGTSTQGCGGNPG